MVHRRRHKDLRIHRDARHSFVVTANIMGQRVRVYGVHMPQRNVAATYRVELHVLESMHDEEEEPLEMVLGDFNRHVVSHVESRTFAAAMGCTIVKDGSQGRLHKDWFLCTSDRLHAAHAWYKVGVADHPTCVLSVHTVQSHCGSGGAVYGHVNARLWGTVERLEFADMIEAVSQCAPDKADWICLHREVMGAVESTCRWTLRDRRLEAGYRKVAQRVTLGSVEMIEERLPVWSSEAADRKWLHIVDNREAVMATHMTGDMVRRLGLRKSIPFATVARVKDTETGELVSGTHLRSVVARVAAERHPPPRTPLPEPWVVQHVGPSIAHNEEKPTKVQRASRKQIIEESQGATLRGVGYLMKARQLVQTAMGQTSWTSAQDGYCAALATTFGMFSLLMLGDLLQCPTEALPEETHAAPLVSIIKHLGDNVNEDTRPILIESGLHRHRQCGWFRRLQRMLTPVYFMHCQFAILKGLSPSDIRRFLYNLLI